MSAKDAGLGAWRVSVLLPDAGPPMKFWGPTIHDAVAEAIRVLGSARQDDDETLEQAVLGVGRPVIVTIAATEWPD